MSFDMVKTFFIPWATFFWISHTFDIYFIPPLQSYWLHIPSAAICLVIRPTWAAVNTHSLPDLLLSQSSYLLLACIQHCWYPQSFVQPTVVLSFIRPTFHPLSSNPSAYCIWFKVLDFDTNYELILDAALSTRHCAHIPQTDYKLSSREVNGCVNLSRGLRDMECLGIDDHGWLIATVYRYLYYTVLYKLLCAKCHISVKNVVKSKKIVALITLWNRKKTRRVMIWAH